MIPSEGTVEDIASALRDYTGPVLIHSRYSGIGKTTLLQMLLNSLKDTYDMSAYELSAIVADEIGVGKSSSTKLTEAKIRRALADADRPVLIGVDEFGLNSKDTLHTIQYLNDLPNTRVLLTGMTSQWQAIGSLGSDGRAFQRRVSCEVHLAPLKREEIGEPVRRRIVTSVQIDTGGGQKVDLDPITECVLDIVHDRSHGVPAVATAALAELVGLAAYRYAEIDEPTITADLASTIDYADPEADIEVESD